MASELRSLPQAERAISGHFRCPSSLPDFALAGRLSADEGYFRFRNGNVLFGQCSSATPAPTSGATLRDVLPDLSIQGSSLQLSFDPEQVIDNLRRERYWRSTGRPGPPEGFAQSLYYHLRPLLGVAVRKYLQRIYFQGWEHIKFPRWPVDFTVENTLETLLALSMKATGAERVPFVWFWPDGAPSCSIVTHDVETEAGRDFCGRLMDLNDSFGIKSSFQVVPEDRYTVPAAFLDEIRTRGHELNVQDLNHDGLLFKDHAEFVRRAGKINHYAREYRAEGFRAAVLYRNPDWYDALHFAYDMSIPNVAHLDPQRGGCCTALPYFIGDMIELPVTLTQDYSLFHILSQYSTDLWRKQIDMIRQRHGLISVIVHPDYILTDRTCGVYVELLRELAQLRDRRETWIALPREVAAWWRKRSQMTLQREGAGWRIEGAGHERARVAYAVRVGDDAIRYELPVADA